MSTVECEMTRLGDTLGLEYLSWWFLCFGGWFIEVNEAILFFEVL